MSTLIKLVKRYKFFLICFAAFVVLNCINPLKGNLAFKEVKSSFLQMLSVLPPIMILLGLMDVWISKKTLMKYMGQESGLMGIFLAILIGSLAAGPMYAAFPFTAVLIKKGVKFSNVITFMNAWCVTKISTLLFEISALGYKFTFVRLAIDLPLVILMGFMVSKFMSEDDLKQLYDK